MGDKLKTFMCRVNQKKMIFLIPFVIICCFTLVYISTKKPLYQATTRAKITDSFGIEPTDNDILSKSLSTIGLLDKNNPLESLAASGYKISTSKDSISGLTEISVVGGKPKEIIKLANEIAGVYVDEINTRSRQMKDELIKKKRIEMEEYRKDLMVKLAVAKKRLEDCEKEIESTRAKEDKNKARVSSLKNKLAEIELERSALLRVYTTVHPDVVKLESEIESLKTYVNSIPTEPDGKLKVDRELKDSRQTYEALKVKWDEASLDKIEEPGVLPDESTVVLYSEKASPLSDFISRKITFLLGFVIAVVFSLFVGLISILLDASILTEDEMQAFTRVPVLGNLPYIKGQLLQRTKIRGKSNLILSYEGSPEIIEPYRHLYTRIQSNIFNGTLEGKSIIMTSFIPQEGKSITAANLALVIARSGKNVLLIDSNLAQSSVHALFGINTKIPGFTDIVSKNVTIDSAIRDVSDILLGDMNLATAIKFKGLDRLKLITAGSDVSDPSEFFRSADITSVIAELKTRFDCIVLDGPSFAASAEAATLISACDAAFIIYAAGKTSKSHLKEISINRPEAMPETARGDMPKNIKGIILNRCI